MTGHGVPGGAARVSNLGFALFLYLNAALFVRPGEIVPDLAVVPFYELGMIACLAVSYAALAAQLSPGTLAGRPVNACAAAMLAAIVLSDLANGEVANAYEHGLEFFKLLLYYFLLVTVVDTPRRLEQFLSAVAVFAAVITALSILHYHDLTNVPSVETVRTSLDESGEAASMVKRLGSTGLFADPNDMCLMLVLAMAVCLYQVVERGRAYWAAPLCLFGYGLMLTHSRGGFLGMLAALVTLLAARFGRKSLLPGLVILPAVFAVFAGRQTSISTRNGTAVTRFRLWADGMNLFAGRPVFGIGTGRYADALGHVAHNSFIHCYTELGVVGGTVFLAAFYLAFWPLVRLGGRGVPALSMPLRRLRPYVLAVVAGYAGGLMSLSCPYIIPTYTVLGLASVCVRLAEDDLGVPVARLDAKVLGRVAALSLAAVATALAVVRVATR